MVPGAAGVFDNGTLAVCELPFQAPVINAVWPEVLNVPAVAVNDTELVPSATVTDAGTVTTVVLLVMLTAAPPAGTVPLNVTVHVVVPPELSDAGEQINELTPAAAPMESDACCEPFRVAETFAVWPAALAAAVAANEPLTEPAGTITCAGTSIAGLSLATETIAPLVGAAPDSTIVQVAAVPAGTRGGAQLNEMIAFCPPPPPGAGLDAGAVSEIEAASDVPA
jgi:hypothetical protein